VVPEFLRRLRARRAQQTPRWLSWNALSMMLAGAAFAFLLWLLSAVLAPFLAAAILAFIFDPLVSRLEGKGLSRGFGTLVAVLTLLLVIVLLLLIVLPLFYKEISQLVTQLPGFADQLKTRAIPWINESLGINLNLDASTFRQFVTDNLSDASGIARKIFSSVGIGGLALAGFLVNLLLIPVVLFYFLRDWHQLIGAVDAMVPRRQHLTVRTIAGEINVILSEFLRGQISVMLIMALFYVAGLWLAGLEFALPVGLITGLLVFIPYLGAGTGLLLGTVAAFMQFPTFTGVLAVWGVFGIGQLIEGFAVTPWLVGDRIGLHPVAVIFALLAFGQVFGFFGVLLALPASAAILVGLRHLDAEYRASDLYRR
jgi:predicted PurR-regulated permease PerM